jgi:HK97 family phage major capsid protein
MDELTSSFEVFKRTNDERLAELERRGSADVLTSDKLARIDSALDAQQKSIDGLIRKASRPMLASTSIDTAAIEHKNAYDVYVRKGETALLSKLESKALSVGSEADGGYLVPAESEMAISRALQTQSPIRAMSSVRRVSSSVYKRPFSTSGANAGWIAETAARAQTGTPGLSELAFPTMELFAMPAATMTLLDDAAVNIDDWLAEEVNDAFAAQESAAFVSGDGNGKPKGFLAYTAVANSAWTWGNMGYVATGVAGGFPASSAADKIIDLIYAVKSPYRANAAFAMSRMTQSALRKLKDGQGNYLWQPSATAGTPATLMGYPVAEVEEMPEIAASSYSIAFGDFKRGYLVVDRTGIRVLRDHFSAKPYVLFYTTKRVGGGVQDFNAIKLLKFAVS